MNSKDWKRSIFVWEDPFFGPRYRCGAHRNWIGYDANDLRIHLRNEHRLSAMEIENEIKRLEEKLKEHAIVKRALNFEYSLALEDSEGEEGEEEEIPFTEDVEPLTETLSVSIGPLLKQSVMEEAKRRGISASRLVRAYIRKGLYGDEDDER